ncbi:putative reverse transcriptase domain-containing protein [Tanacetum coccineum]|uniref:Reverse transcriptase domain-containing protein n=1 Tax=Tanacetum coccineum TaxID=301880 RepID=A0ABQ5A8C8_9ASTR
MAPKRRTTRLNLSATPTPITDTHTTTSVTNAQIQEMINEGVTAALAVRDATRNGYDSHTSNGSEGLGSPRRMLKWKNNNNQGNQVGNAKAQAKVYAGGNAGVNPDNNVVTGTFLLNNRYASILFDTGADRSFVSTAFSSR